VSKLFEEGDEIEIDLDNLKLRNVKTGKEISFEPLAESQREIIAAGGILPLLKKMTS